MLFIKHFRHYYLKFAYTFIPGIVLLVAIDWFQLEIPRLLNRIMTAIEENQYATIDDVIPYLTEILIIVAVMTVGRFVWRWLLVATGRQIETLVREQMFMHASTMDQDFYSHQKVGGLMTLFTNDLDAIRIVFAWGLLLLIDGLVLGTFALTRMFSIHATMTLFSFIPLALMAIALFFIGKKMEIRFKRRQEAFEKMSDFALENYSGISVIKAYVREVKESLTFDKKAKEVYDKNINFLRYSIIVNIIIGLTITLVILSIIAFGSYLIAAGHLSRPTMVEYSLLFFSLIWPVFAISQFVYFNGQAQASAKRIHQFLETKSKLKEKQGSIKDVNLAGAITANNLSFTYPDGNHPVLSDVSFEIKAGQMIGILGRTGSGKSSLVELLLHIYNVEKGMIYFDSYDMMDLDIKSLREHIGYVPQDNFLYSDTISANIGFSFKEPDHEKVVEAAKLSDVYDNIIEFKDQFDTVLGERGVTVSGGQKQRISIARAIAKNPPILILDDSVSAVDTKTEEAIINNLKKIRKNKTTIVIAHRISTVKKLDKIILLDKGKLVGFGSHKELLENSPLYQDMVKLQQLEKLVEEESK